MRYFFEDCALDADRREFYRGEVQVAVEPQVLDLLLHLIRNRDRVVTRDDLIATVWQGRIVSESALSTRINAARAVLGDNGRDQRLIRTLLRKGFRFVGSIREEEAAIASAEPPSALALPSKPSIAVLPFRTIGDSSRQDYFIDGVVEDIITELSRFPELFVIARNSSFTYKGKAIDIRQVGRDLGVRYVLEGSVRRRGNDVRIAAQLIDASSAAHIWADRFEAKLVNIFALQDEMARSVVGAIAPKLEQAEIYRAKQTTKQHLSAYDCFLRGMAGWHAWTEADHNRALKHFYRAIELDPGFGRAYALAAACYVMRKANGWTGDRTAEIAEAERLARSGADHGQFDAVALCWSAHALAHVVGDIAAGIGLVDRALRLNPNLSVAWQRSGWLRIYEGDCELAIDHLERAMRLNPLDPLMHLAQSAMGFAYFLLKDFAAAAAWAERALNLRPNWPAALRVLAMSNALAGRDQAARQALLRVLQFQPHLRVSTLHEQVFLHRPEHMNLYSEAMRRAGLPQ